MIETNKVTVRSSMLPISDSGKEHTTTLQGHLGQQTQALNNSIARNNKGITELFAEKRKVDDELADTKEAHAQWLGETGKLAYTNNWLANTGGTGFYKAEREAVAKNENFTQKINVLQKQSDTYTQLIDSTTQNSKASLAHETSTITGGGRCYWVALLDFRTGAESASSRLRPALLPTRPQDLVVSGPSLRLVI